MNDTTLARIADSLERIASVLERYNEANSPKVVTFTPNGVEVKNAPEQTTGLVGQIHSYEPGQAEPIAHQPEEVKPTVTIDQIRKKVVQLSAAGAETKDAVRTIITEYGRNVSAIPADKYPEVMDRLNALQEG